MGVFCKRKTTEQFIAEARAVHGDRYDYSKVDYKGKDVKVCIICPIHGEFWQLPSNHLRGSGCYSCNRVDKQTMPLSEFIRCAIEAHGCKYDYSKVKYKNSITPVCIICPVHGEFWQRPIDHLQGKGCRKCGGTDRLTTEEFIRRARLVHGDKYDYSKVVYVNGRTEVCIICPIHGEFWQKPQNHLHGRGCHECASIDRRNSKRKTTSYFIEKARLVHGDKFDYSKSIYKGWKHKICIICPDHGEFWQDAGSHLCGIGCPKCAGHGLMNREEFIRIATIVHNGRYDYTNVNWVDTKTKICIVCPKHGDFWQWPYDHLKGCGCRLCAIEQTSEKNKMTLEDFIQRANIIHNKKFDYSKSVYKSYDVKLTIICPIHGEFEQTPHMHLMGQGCPYCKESHGERDIAKWLDRHNLEYNRQYNIIPQQVLFGRNRFRVDFYLPTYNTIIEFNGSQHYERATNWQTEDEFAEQQDRDRRLREYCKRHKIRLIEIPYTEIDNIDKILTKQLLKSNKIL